MTDVKVMPTGELLLKVQPIAARVARTVARNFEGYVTAEDMQQDLLLWAYDHLDKVQEYLTPTDEDPKAKAGNAKLHTTFRRKARGWAHKAKADKLGYDVADVHFYSLRQLEELLPLAFDYECWLPEQSNDNMPTGKSDPALGNNRFALLADVKGAYEKCPDVDRTLLWARYVASPPAGIAELAESAGVSRATMTRRINRALTRMLDHLGGSRPEFGVHVGRKAMSNDEAQSLTRRDFD